MTKEKGIVLLAGFHHSYATSAMGLVASIRKTDKETPIIVYTTQGLIPEKKLHVFEVVLNAKVKVLDSKYYMTGNQVTFVKAKTHLYELSPFQKTIYLDVDMVWLPRKTPGMLFSSLEGCPFTTISEGYFDTTENILRTSGFYYYWSDKYDIVNAYPDIKKHGKLWQLRSEFMYFEKSPETKKLFSLVKKIYAQPLTRPTKIGESLPDEYAFNIATSIMGMPPHSEQYSPVFWDFKRMIKRQTPVDEHTIMSQYYAYSVGGNETQPDQKSFYNRQIKGSMNAMGIPGYSFTIRDKKDFKELKREKM